MSNFGIIAKVYSTDDYDLFKKLENNRIVYESRVKKLISSFKNGEILNPIIVNDSFQIIDGQGRYEALKALGRPIKFIVVKDATISDCMRMNHYNSKWNTMDFIDSYSRSEDENISNNYKRLLETMKSTGMSSSRVIRLANKATHFLSGGENVMVIESGILKFTDDDMRRVIEIVDYGKKVINALMENKKTNDAFWNSINIIYFTEGFDKDRFIKKCQEKRHSYAQASRLLDQLKEFSRIYNSGLSAKTRIYFEDYMRNRGDNVRDYSTNYFEQRKDVSTLAKEDD